MEQKLTASNGVHIYHYKLPNTHSICISLYVRAGALYESGNSGITHFLEHLHFRKLGGRTQKELYYQIEKIGGYFGASTYKEFIEFNLTSSPKYFSDLAKIASDLLGEIEADSKDFAGEKRLVLSEIREDNQKNDIDYAADKYIWSGTNLQNPVLGNISSVKKFTLQMLRDEKERVFTPQNIFFYVTGNYEDHDIAGLIKEVERYSLSNRSNNKNNNLAEIPVGFKERNAFAKISHRTFSMHEVKIAFDIDFKQISRFELVFLDSILANGLCSPIRAELIEKKGLIYSFSSTIEQYANIGVYYFKFEIYKSKLYETVKSLVSVINAVKNGITELDVSTARVFKTDNQMTLLDDPESLNWMFAYENHILNLGYQDIDQLSNAYRQIDKEQLMKLANVIFVPDNVSIISIGNKKGVSEEKLHEILMGLLRL